MKFGKAFLCVRNLWCIFFLQLNVKEIYLHCVVCFTFISQRWNSLTLYLFFFFLSSKYFVLCDYWRAQSISTLASSSVFPFLILFLGPCSICNYRPWSFCKLLSSIQIPDVLNALLWQTLNFRKKMPLPSLCSAHLEFSGHLNCTFIARIFTQILNAILTLSSLFHSYPAASVPSHFEL